MDSTKNRRHRVLIAKEKVLQQSKHFFTAELGPFVRKLAITLGYLPASDDIMDDQVYEGLERILGPDGFVRGSKRRAVPAGLSRMSKYEALFGDLPEFDSFRESFFVHGDARMTLAGVLQKMGSLVESGQAFPDPAVDLTVSLVSWVQAMTIDESPPASFSTVAWDTYLGAIQSNIFLYR